MGTMSDDPIIKAQELSIGYDNKAIISGLNFSIEKGGLCCLLGANGIGKSTLLKSLSGLLAPIGGTIEINRQSISQISAHEKAKKISIVLNNQSVNPDLLVHELIELGRSPHTSWLGHLGEEDNNKVKEALHSCQLEKLFSRI